MTESFPTQQCAAVSTKYLWITVPPQRLARSLLSVKNSRRTIQFQCLWTTIPLTTRRFLVFRIFEFWSIEQNWRSKYNVFSLILNLQSPFDNTSERGWKQDWLAFKQSFCSSSDPLQSYCSEQIRLRNDLHDPKHSVHCDQVAWIHKVIYGNENKYYLWHFESIFYS